MKKITIATLAALMIGAVQAEYMIKIPLEQAQGGRLPNGSILITSNLEDAQTVYGEWLDQGHPYDCTNWFPDPSTVPSGEEFTQEATDCSQDQTRTAQGQEVETRTVIVSSTRDSVGTLISSWEQFASDNGLSETWNDLKWQSKGLSYIPTSPYPITSVGNLDLSINQLTNVDGLSNLTNAGTIFLHINQLTNVDGLSNLTSVDILNLSSNQLTNVDGLSNLTRFGRLESLYLQGNKLTNVDVLSNIKSFDVLQLSNNQLTNVNGLSNLTRVRILNLHTNKLKNVDGLRNLTSVSELHLHINQLTNVDGLANVKVSRQIRIDATYSGPKLAANTIFCIDNRDSVFPVGDARYAQKSQLCESP